MSDTITCADCGIPIGVPPEEIEDGKEYRCVRCQIGNEVVRLKQPLADKDRLIDQLANVVKGYLKHCGNNYQICGLNTQAKAALAAAGKENEGE